MIYLLVLLNPMRHFKVSPIPIKQHLNYDMVDMPPFDGDWADRRYTHETIAGEPQTSLNGRPQNIPRNAQLMDPLDAQYGLCIEREMRHQRAEDYREGSFPWGFLEMEQQKKEDWFFGIDNPAVAIIQILLLLNIAIFGYLLLRQ